MMKMTTLFVLLAISTALILGSIVPQELLAANIICIGAASCLGTNNLDNMLGDAAQNDMLGLGGDDKMNGRGGDDSTLRGFTGDDIIMGEDGNDVIEGAQGNDKISGGNDDDLLSGGFDADLISGGNGNDRILHGPALTGPDRSKDRIDCGPGNDEAWINVSVDGDLAINCEILNAG
jgi:RTX calcium-binding nonapeptide repeat (4 copies)